MHDISRHERRTFLKLSGGVLGGVFAGSTVTAAERTDRFIVETTSERLPSELDVVHELPGIAFAVVEGSESGVKRSKAVKGYAADIEVELDAPDVNEGVPTFDASDDEGQPGDVLQWDRTR